MDVRQKIVDGNPHTKAIPPNAVGQQPWRELRIRADGWKEGAAFALSFEVNGITLGELAEKAESGKLVELDDDQSWPKIPEHCAGIVLERDRILRAAGFRRVKVKG